MDTIEVIEPLEQNEETELVAKVLAYVTQEYTVEAFESTPTVTEDNKMPPKQAKDDETVAEVTTEPVLELMGTVIELAVEVTTKPVLELGILVGSVAVVTTEPELEPVVPVAGSVAHS